MNNPTRTIWLKEGDPTTIQVIDQRFLPHKLEIFDLKNYQDVVFAIKDMIVRGAPLIGVSAAYGLYLAALCAPSESTGFDVFINKVAAELLATRPTAVNLHWAITKSLEAINHGINPQDKINIALEIANKIAEEDVENCRKIGVFGLNIFKDILSKKNPGETLNILTHCNAGWLACVEWGTAISPIYQAHRNNLPIHVWVDETRPRNQGFNLTAWELGKAGVSHTLLVDNAGGHLMQHGKVDIVIVGADRITRNGDAANKIGTYLKALAAYDNQIPFYVAAPSSSIDWNIKDGVKEIAIEERHNDEVKYIQGWEGDTLRKVLIAPENSPAANYCFDVTPARLITGIITERGVCEASEDGLMGLFREYRT